MGQFSVEKPALPGSVLSGNQHRILNPLSHDPTTSLNEAEVVAAVAAVEALGPVFSWRENG
jgi:hypothetical protein